MIGGRYEVYFVRENVIPVQAEDGSGWAVSDDTLENLAVPDLPVFQELLQNPLRAVYFRFRVSLRDHHQLISVPTF